MKREQNYSYYNSERERLKREIAKRQAQLEVLEASIKDTPQRLISESNSRRRKFSQKSYLSFLISSVRESRIYGIWERLIKYFRRFRLLTMVFQIISYVITLIGTGALFVSFFSILIIALPFALLGTLIAYFNSLLSRGKIKRQIETSVYDSPLTIIYMPVMFADNSSADFVFKTASMLADKGQIVFIIHPLNSKHRFKTAADDVFYINQMDYFYFDKKYFRKNDKITHIHL